LFGTVLVLWLYRRDGREFGRMAQPRSRTSAADPGRTRRSHPYAIVVAKGTLHCGSGCAIGDFIAESTVYFWPTIAIALGWKSLFMEKTYAAWVLDSLLAFGFGILFQYWAIVPMRGLSPGAGLWVAIKADLLSLLAWQVGMCCAMAAIQFLVLPHEFGGRAPVDSVEFWAAMQLAMLAGFATSYPMNWWLIGAGIKQGM
jgi:hypothetical protein